MAFGIWAIFILFICSVKSDISDCCIISELNDIIFSIGLGFLSSGKYFAINNGPYYQNYDIRVPDDVWSYITEQREQQEKKDEAEAQLRQLVTLNDQVKAIAVPHDGYVAAINVKEGEVWDSTHPLLTVTPEGV